MTEEQKNKICELVIEHIKKSKHKFISVDEVSTLLRSKLKSIYTSELSISIKQMLVAHKNIDFFREGDYIMNNKFYYCTGNWLCYKGTYKNPVEAKKARGWYAYQESDEDF